VDEGSAKLSISCLGDRPVNATGSFAADAMPCWHALSVAEVAQQLGVDAQTGLDPHEAQQRATVYGPNEIQEHRR